MRFLYCATIFASIVFINADPSVKTPSLSRKRKSSAMELEIQEELDDFGKLGEDWFRLLQENSVPSIESCSYDVDLDCHLSDDLNIPCSTYSKRLATDLLLPCDAEVQLKYIFKNTADVTDTLEGIDISINGEMPFVSIIKDIPQENLSLDPHDTLSFKQKKLLNFCKFYDSGIMLKANLKCENGDEILKDTSYMFNGEPIKPSCDARLTMNCRTPAGGECIPKLQEGTCYFRPLYLDLALTPSLCFESRNKQGEKFACIDDNDLPYTDDLVQDISVYVKVLGSKSGAIYYSGYVPMKDGTFTIGNGSKLDSDVKVLIFDRPGGIPLQTIRFHTSCSVPLAINDSYGAITIVGMRDDVHVITKDSVDEPNIFLFSYTIANPSRIPIVINNIQIKTSESEYMTVPFLDRTQVLPRGEFSGMTSAEISTSSSCFEAEIQLDYDATLGFNTKSCSSSTRFGTMTGKKSKKSKKSGSCPVGKGTSSKKSSKSMKSAKGSSISKSASSKGKGSKSSIHSSMKSKSKSGKSSTESGSKGSKSSKGGKARRTM